MTNQEEQELNKKLARWIGFKSNEPDKEWGRWILWGEPAPKTLIQKRIASGNLNAGLCFTQSLDRCFKWLEPKLDDWKLQKDKDAVIAGVWLDNKYENDRNKNPALAFCLALEKLIVKELLKQETAGALIE